ncbi:MAG: alkaline phosphatase family protein [Paludibacter sp.]|nr:alkaline phosphatase family protein [Paludibacter sp.]
MNFKKYFLAILFLITCISINCVAQKSPERPKLIVGIVIDGIQQQHVDLLWEQLSPDGFKRVIERGSAFSNAQYNILSSGNIVDFATLMSGSVPCYNGITGSRFFNRKTHAFENILADNEQSGIRTDLKLSAKRLLSTTFTDELKMALPASRTFAVAVNPEEALMLGGHTANAVVWIDDAIHWSSTSYYNSGLPKSADEMNFGSYFNNYIFSVWKPLKNIDNYINKPTKETAISGFRYDMRFRNEGEQKISDLKHSPAANSLITELAMRIIDDENLGKQSKSSDVLLLQYTVRQVDENSSALNSAEKEDMYYRLDVDIASLLEKIEKTVGLANTLIFVTGNQTGTHSPKELKANNIPAGTFSPKRSMSLLNLYLMAIYGNESWVEGYFANNIYLNREKINDKKLKINDVQQSVADFMLEFTGIQEAFTAAQIATMSGDENRIRNSYNKLTGGDVVIKLLPGWQEIDENDKPVSASESITNSVPLYFFGWKIKKQRTDNTVYVTDLAATLCSLLNIPQPNACAGKVLSVK